MHKTILFCSCLLFFTTVQFGSSKEKSLVNTKHLDYLYQEIKVDGKELGIIHIYCEYPDYKWVGDEDEGIACVDDATRAAIFYMRYSEKYNDKECNRKAKNLIEFLLYMQAENGYFYNFILPDFSINKTYKTSVAEPNWWSWRAMWCLTEAYEFFNKKDETFSKRIKESIMKIVSAMKEQFNSPKTILDLDGFKRPTWLPYQYASDQSSLIIVSLCNYYNSFKDESILPLVKSFSDGILLMQEGDAKTFPHYAIISWENSWHAWGNMQSYSLLKAYQVTNDKRYRSAALNEINHFFKYQFDSKFITGEFSLKKMDGKTTLNDEKKYTIGAYGITSMVFAAIEAAKITKDKKYSMQAAELASWFFGHNTASAQMYFPGNGICYDGITNENVVNKNSGAESTVEALFTMLMIENDLEAKKKLLSIINEH